MIPRPLQPLLRMIGQIADEFGVSAYAVGGCVRDWMVGIDDTKDLDVVVEGRGMDVAQAVQRALKATLTVHQQFGTATMLMTSGTRQRRIDFVTARQETYAKPAAYPRVQPGTLEEDLFRRDFTINAMALAISPGRFGTQVDPFHGACDVTQKQLRVLHDRSFLDDPSRILRGIRFAQRFGLQWEPHTRTLLREALAEGALGWLNAGRLHKELAQMGQEPNAHRCFEQLAALLSALPSSRP